MRGNNHSDDCGCEWCGNVGWNVDSWGGGGAGGGVPSFPVRLPGHLEGEPEPNAKCPVCGERVHFRQLDNGGRVYFDALGPPWPKHPCTDNSFAASSIVAPTGWDIPDNVEPSVEPADDLNIATGWTPFRFVSQKKGSRGDSPAHHLGWTTARARNLAASSWESWLVTEPLDIRRFDLAYRSDWSADGQAVVSYLAQVDSRSFSEFEAVVWSERRYAEIDSESVMEAFSIEFEARGRWALERYLARVDLSRFFGSPSKDSLLNALDRVVNEVRQLGWQDDKERVEWMRERVRETLWEHVFFDSRLLQPIMQLVVAYY